MDNLNKSGQKQPEADEANLITLLKQPSKFKDVFYQLNSSVSDALRAQEYEKAIQILSRIMDMLDLGKTILKDINKFWKLCIYANFACAYQGIWKIQKCNKYCERIEQQIQKLISNNPQREQVLNLTRFMIKFKFQYCAILSQLNQHEKALDKCKSTIPIIVHYIQSILQYTQSVIANPPSKKSSQIVHFSKQVCSFAQNVLKNLLQCLNQPIEIVNAKSSFYYWQKNPQNNEEQVKRKFAAIRGQNCKRSILGVNKSIHWIDQFNIGTLMHMGQISITDFEETVPLEEYLFKDKIFQTVIHCSVAHFTIATQMRFIETSKEKPQESRNQLPHINVINAKYGYNEKSEMFKLSEMYHLKAIDLMAKNIKTTVPYLSHLIKSYDKHYIYKKELQPIIAEQSSISMTQPNISLQKPSSINMEGDIYFQNLSKIKKQEPINVDLQFKKPKQEIIDYPQETLTKSRRARNGLDLISPTFVVETDRKKKYKSVGKSFPKITLNKGKEKNEKTKKNIKKKKQPQLKPKVQSCSQIKFQMKKKK